jgi:hypothetical protein
MRHLRGLCVVAWMLAAVLPGGAVAARRSPPSTASPPPPSRIACLDPDTFATHARAMTQWVKNRLGSEFARPVTFVCLSADSARILQRGLAAEALAHERSSGRLAVYEQLGLRPITSPDSVMVPAAWYEPGADLVRVVADSSLKGGLLDEILVHELTHALHDQLYDLRRFMPDAGDTTSWDEEQAGRSLIEGQAQWVQLQHELVAHDLQLSDGDLSVYYWELERVSLSEEAKKQARLERLGRPRGARTSVRPREISMLVWLPMYWYQVGLVFADQMVADGGIARLGQVLRSPPSSMQHLLHPARYLPQASLPRAFRPGPAGDVWPGSVELNRDTYGMIMMRLYFEMHGQGKLAGFLTKGWDGDLLLLLNKGADAPVLLWWTVWGTPWDAAGFAEGYRATLRDRGVRKSLGPEVWRGADPDRRWAVWREENKVLILENAAAAELTALRAAMSRVAPEAAAPDSATTAAPDSSGQ